MNEDQLFVLYEKLYFQELDRREKLSSRLNVPLAVLVATIGFLSFMLNSAPNQSEGAAQILFWFFFVCACIAVSIGTWFFKSSWFGHTDKLLPTANETEAYRQTLIEFYEEFDEKKKLVEDALRKYLYDYYKQFSSQNTTNNDARSYHLYLATYAITVSVFLAFLAFIPYFFVKHERANNDEQATPTTASSTSSEERERRCAETPVTAAAPSNTAAKSLKSKDMSKGTTKKSRSDSTIRAGSTGGSQEH